MVLIKNVIKIYQSPTIFQIIETMAQREQPDPFLAPDLLPPNFVPPGYAVPNLDNFNYCDNLPGPIDPGTEPVSS